MVGSYGFAIGLALVVGATSVLESWVPLVLIGALIFLYVSLKRPSVPVFFAFVGIMLDAQGMTAFRFLGLPVTIGKVAVLYALGAHVVHRLVLRQRLFSWTPVTAGLFAMLMTMLMSLVNAVDPAWGYADVMGVMMLSLLVHLVYDTVDEEGVEWIVRLMGITVALVLLWTIVTQRKQGFFVTLDHAWQQRTSGAFGDPNAWSTCLLVVCPMLIGAVARDRHWISGPLLLALVALFPAGILQSMSRAGLISFVLVSPGLLYLLRDRRWVIAGGVVVVLLSLPLFVNIDAMLLRYRTLMDPTLEADLGHGSLRERAALLEAGLQMFWENPVMGVGVGLFRVHASYVSAGEVWKIAHNSYLNVAAEQGIPGIISHLYLGYLLAQSIWHCAVRTRTELTQGLGGGMLVSFAGFCIMALTLNLNTFAVAYYMLGFGLMVCKLGGAEEVIDRAEEARRQVRPPQRLAAR